QGSTSLQQRIIQEVDRGLCCIPYPFFLLVFLQRSAENAGCHLNAQGLPTMTHDHKKVSSKYTCNEYREEMILLGLRQKLLQSDLTAKEKEKLTKEIARLEKAIGF
ncbi:MAG: hypothetical protein GQ542_11055, partial [Desulforhopalus sp.]|nr:hypothetical protein [Desulforhopalus sp.]